MHEGLFPNVVKVVEQASKLVVEFKEAQSNTSVSGNHVGSRIDTLILWRIALVLVLLRLIATSRLILTLW